MSRASTVVDRAGEGAHAEAPVRLEDAYLPLSVLATYSGLSVRILRDYLKHPSRPLPCFRIGGKVLVRRSEFDAWAQQFRSVAPSRVDAIVREALRGL